MIRNECGSLTRDRSKDCFTRSGRLEHALELTVPRIRQRGHRYTFYTLDRHRWIAGVCPSLGVGDRERTRKQSSVLRPLQWAQGCVFRLGNTWPSDSSMFSVSDRNFTFTARTPYSYSEKKSMIINEIKELK